MARPGLVTLLLVLSTSGAGNAHAQPRNPTRHVIGAASVTIDVPRFPRVQNSCSERREPPDGAIRVTEAVPYMTVGDEVLALDVAHPGRPGARPAVMVIHGGGWQAGERAHVRGMIETLAASGYVGVGVTYRLTVPPAENQFPDAVADVRCAIRFLRHEARRFSIDPNRVGVIGYSAGGHLAGMLATASDVAGLDDPSCRYTESPAPQAVVTYYAPFDFTSRHYRARPRRLIGEFVGSYRPDRLQLASPLFHVDSGDTPMLILHGSADRVVPVTEAQHMRAQLREHGVPFLAVELPGADHGFTMMSTAENLQPAVCTTWNFLNTLLQVER